MGLGTLLRKNLNIFFISVLMPIAADADNGCYLNQILPSGDQLSTYNCSALLRNSFSSSLLIPKAL